MRYITKGLVHHHQLSNAATLPPSTSAEATSRWSSLNRKDSLLKALLREQFGLCCYSETDGTTIGFHIEHIENKSQNPNRTFDYNNLAASAFDSAHGLKTTPADLVFGGHARGKSTNVDMTQFIHPHMPDCASYFVYLQDGRVVANLHKTSTEQSCATYTIDLLNLNSPLLVSKRREYWAELETWFATHLVHGSVDDLASVCLLPTGNKLYPFFSLTHQFFGPLSARVIRASGVPGL